MKSNSIGKDRTLNDRIFSLRPTLSMQHRKLADYILRNGDLSCFFNARELASAAGVSPSTIVRFSRQLGFDGFQSLKSALQERVRIQLTHGERFSMTLRSLRNRDLVKQIFEQDIALLQSTLRLIRKEDFYRAVDGICQASTVYILGLRSAFALAYFAYFRLSRYGVNCKLVTFGGPGLFSEIAPIKKGDVLLAIGFEKIATEVRDAAEFARRKKAHVITITTPASPPLPLADIALYMDRSSARRLQSVTAGLTLCLALVRGVAARKGKRSVSLLNEIDAMTAGRPLFAREH